jgi:hypothetical protein
MAQVLLTAKRSSPTPNRDNAPPKIAQLQTEQVQKVKPFKKGVSILYGTSQRPWKKYRMAETPAEWEGAQRLATGLTSNVLQNLSASGTTQGNSQAITAYHSAVTAAQGAASGGLLLPAASTKFNNGGAYVVNNQVNQALTVYPSASEYIDSGASNIGVTVAALSRMHFYASASNRWLSASTYE